MTLLELLQGIGVLIGLFTIAIIMIGHWRL